MEIKKKKKNLMIILKTDKKRKKKNEEEVNHPRYIHNLFCEMMQFGKLINKYKTKMSLTLKTLKNLSKMIKENKEIRKRAAKAIDDIKK